MHRGLVGTTMCLAPFSLAVAAFAVGYSATHPTWWTAAIHLAVLGGITMMIYAVNIRIVPVFARRDWTSARLLLAQVVAGMTGAWLVFLGKGLQQPWLDRGGEVLALVGGVLFMFNVAKLFHQKSTMPPTVNRYEMQGAVDKAAIGFTKLSATLLLVGLAIGVMLSWWRPGFGRWDLVWAHTMLVGWFMTMAGGVCYHMLSRWTNFLTDDGEKKWRERDAEFEKKIITKEELIIKWDAGWDCLFAALNSLSDNDLDKTVYLRQEPLKVVDAINRQLAHYSYHVGQIVYLGKMQLKDNWVSLSIPKKELKELNENDDKDKEL